MLIERRAIELSEKQATDIENIREAEVNMASKRFKKTTTQCSQFNKATSNSTLNCGTATLGLAALLCVSCVVLARA